MVNKTKINEAIMKHKEHIISTGITEDRIIFIGLYGSQNYKTSGDFSDVDTRAFIIPTFTDLCSLDSHLSKDLELENEEKCDIKDIRAMGPNLLKMNINFLELLYTEYYWINPVYADLFNKLIEKREIISHYDIKKAVVSIAGQVLGAVKREIKMDEYVGKTAYNSKRLLRFLHDYVDGVPYAECICTKDDLFLEELKRLKYGDVSQEELKLISAECKLEAESLLKEWDCKDFIPTTDAKAIFEEVTAAIIKRYLQSEL